MKIEVRRPPAQTGAPFLSLELRRLSHGTRVVLVALALISVYLFGAFTARLTLQPLDAWITRLDLQTMVNYLQGRMAAPPRLSIDISLDNFNKLAYQRELALKRGIIVTTDESYVPARVTVAGRTHRVKLRLKGDYTDHLEGDKWSLRIRVRDDGAILGMRRFSIQDPSRSGWITEWIFHRFLAHEGLIALHYDFVQVVLNGKDYGIYALEESFAPALIARNERPEGPILKFDESRQIDRSLVTRGDFANETDLFMNAEIISFLTDRTYRNEEQRRLFLSGRELLSAFREGRKRVADVFDLERTARVFAVADVLNAYHAIRWKNIRFYMNPVTFRLEPIAYNAYTAQENLGPHEIPGYAAYAAHQGGALEPFHRLFFADPDFQSAYLSELHRLTGPGYMQQFFASLEPDLQRELQTIYRDYPKLRFSVQPYFEIAAALRAFLNPRQALRSHVQAGADRSSLAVANPTRVPMTLRGIRCVTDGNVLEISDPEVLAAKAPGRALAYRSVQLAVEAAALEPCLAGIERSGDAMVYSKARLVYSVLGSQIRRSAPVEAYPLEGYLPDMPGSGGDRERLTELALASGLFEAGSTEVLRFKRGKLRLRETLVIPAGKRVIAPAGMQLRLADGASLISYSPVAFEGTEQQRIEICAAGEAAGMLIVKAHGRSRLSYVDFCSLGSPVQGAWRVRGAVSFYESDVSITHSNFLDAAAEDALNIVRSDFSIKHATFRRARSDALDTDFSTGTIEASSFIGCGNDCIDTSGSRITVTATRLSDSGDKGVSVGEGSEIRIDGLEIADAHIGIVSKDNSSVQCRNVTIRGSDIGIAAFQKKAEYGPASIEIRNVDIRDSGRTWLLEEGSTISLNGKSIEPNAQALQAQLYGS